MTAVRARYENGVLTPLDPLDLAEGAEVLVSVEGAPRDSAEPRANALEDMAALAKRLIEKYPHDGRDQFTDGSINYKHYLYGHPRKEQ